MMTRSCGQSPLNACLILLKVVAGLLSDVYPGRRPGQCDVGPHHAFHLVAVACASVRSIAFVWVRPSPVAVLHRRVRGSRIACSVGTVLCFVDAACCTGDQQEFESELGLGAVQLEALTDRDVGHSFRLSDGAATLLTRRAASAKVLTAASRTCMFRRLGRRRAWSAAWRRLARPVLKTTER